jgi:hypothetical protein
MTELPQNNQVSASSAKYTFSLVGTATENGEKCRWIEMRIAPQTELQDRATFLKVLVPEKSLLESDQPSDQIVRCWMKFGYGQNAGKVFACKTVPNATGDQNARRICEAAFIVFPGLRRKFERREEPKTVDYQQGRLTVSHALEGKVAGNALPFGRGGDLVMASDSEFTFWTDPAVGPGIAAANVKRTTRYNDIPRTLDDAVWTLEDVGSGAKSELPDQN